MNTSRFFRIALLITISVLIFSAACQKNAKEAVPVSKSVYPAEAYIGGFVLGPQAWTFNRYSFFEAVDKTKEVGCSVIEAIPSQKLSPDDDTIFNHNSPAEVLDKVRAKLAETGVMIVNYGVVKFKNDEAECRKVFDFAKAMGIPIIAAEPAGDSFDLLEKLVKEYDIKIAIHNHPKRADNPDYKYWDPNYVLECVKDRDPRIGSCADTGHWLRSGIIPVDALKILDGRVISSHLKDLNEMSPEAHDVPYGTGIADITGILDELKRQKFAGNISIEYEYNWTTSIPEIKQCVEFVREYGKTNP